MRIQTGHSQGYLPPNVLLVDPKMVKFAIKDGLECRILTVRKLKWRAVLKYLKVRTTGAEGKDPAGKNSSSANSLMVSNHPTNW